MNTTNQLRDDFAAAALQGILASYGNPDAVALPDPDAAARDAYRYANAMLKAREGEDKQ